jgi:tetratricopeptide (TPR) repeat protein
MIRGVSFLFLALCAACAAVPGRSSDSGFAERYHVYQALSKAGYVSINKKDYKAAIDQYTQAIALSPFVASDHYYRGLARFKEGQDDAAIEDFDQVILLDSRWVPAYIYRGLARERRGEYEQALADYTAALNLKTDDPMIHNNLAWLYITAKDRKIQDKAKALEHAKKAAELTKEGNAEILDTLATAYSTNGSMTEALEVEKKALKLDPVNQTYKEKAATFERSLRQVGSKDREEDQQAR